MLEDDAMQSSFPPLVRDIEICTEYPGYKHHFFKTFAEVYAYFVSEYGEDWLQEEWAKFWIGQHNLSRRALRREIAILSGKINPQKTQNRYNRDSLLAVAREEREKNVKLTVRRLRKSLCQHGFYVSVGTTFSVLRQLKHEETLDVLIG